MPILLFNLHLPLKKSDAKYGLPLKKEINRLKLMSVFMKWFILFLGMHFSQAVAIIQTQVGIIKGVQVLYNDAVRKSYFLVII